MFWILKKLEFGYCLGFRGWNLASSNFMLKMNDIKIGTFCRINNEPYVVLSTQHVQMGRGGAVLRTKLKNLLTGNVFERTFKSGDSVGETDIAKVKANYLYSDADFAHFMEIETYDQFNIAKTVLGDKAAYLKEDTEVEILKFDDRPININLPPKMTLKVAQTADAVRGDTAQGNITKEATLENGLIIKVPHFIRQDDYIIVNTETGEYAERAAKK